MRGLRSTALVVFGAVWAASAPAQITLDGTMGPAGALAGPNFTIPDTSGTTLGSNLFHSFGAFNIHAGESATFTGPGSIDHVISRVTGGSASQIDGLLRSTIPTADLYLINPAGLMLKENATLDINGSFYGSTADALRFSDGSVFNASNPPDTVLTTAPPASFGFLNGNPAPITVDRSDLTVPSGATLSLVGGDISIRGEGGDVRHRVFPVCFCRRLKLFQLLQRHAPLWLPRKNRPRS